MVGDQPSVVLGNVTEGSATHLKGELRQDLAIVRGEVSTQQLPGWFVAQAGATVWVHDLSGRVCPARLGKPEGIARAYEEELSSETGEAATDEVTWIVVPEKGRPLDKALADGAVKLVSTTTEKGKGKRIRTGTSEHAEYFVDEQRVVLNGGQPLLVDSEKGRTTGCELTWWANNDRLLVGGGQNCPVQTVIPKK